MPIKRPVKPPAGKKKTSAPAPGKKPRGGASPANASKGNSGKRKRASGVPRAGEDLYRSLFLESHSVMVIVDPHDGRIVDANREAARFYGYTVRKLKSLHVSDINMLDPVEIRLRISRALKRRQRDFQFRHRLADGSIRDVEVSTGPIELGGKTLLYSIARDITERMRVEEGVRKERDFTSAVLDTAGALVIVLDREGRITRFNRACEAVTGYSSAEVMGRIFWEFLVPPEDLQGVRQKWAALWAGDFPNQHENHWVSKDGTRHLISWSNTAITHSRGEIEYVIGTGIDITTHKQAEEALRDSLETASAMLNAATESFALIDVNGVVLAANETFARRFGTALDAIIGTSVLGYLDEEPAQSQMERLMDVVRSGQPLRFADERKGRWFEHSLYPIFDSRGKVARLVSYAQDITDRRRSEEALKQSEALLKSIFQAAPIGIGIVYNRILGWTNDQAARMLGYSVEELAEKSARILYDSNEEFERVGREKYVEVRRGGTGVIETQWKRKDGMLLDILLSSKAIDPRDLSAGVVFTALDISDRKRSEEALQRYSDELEQRVRERTAELMVTNQALILEIEDRNRAEKALGDSERRLSDIIAFLPDATFVIGGDGRVIAWNRSMETLTGIPAKEMLGKGDYEYALPFYGERRPLLIDLVLADDEEIALQFSTGIQRRGDVLSSESHIPKLADGREGVCLAGTAAPLFDSQGNLVGAIESMKDITEQERAKEKLRRSEEKYRTIFENTLVGIFQSTPEGRYLSVNPAFARMYGYESPEDVVSTVTDISVQVFADAEDRRRCIDILQETGILERFEARTRRKDGSLIWTRINSRMVRDADGRLLFIEGVIEDISERKRAEEAMRYRDAILEVAGFAAERFLKAPSWEADIREVLDRLGTVTGASRAYIFENHTSDEGVLLTSQRYEWVADGIRPEISNPILQNYPMEKEGFSRWVEAMRRGEPIRGIVRELPEGERGLLESQDTLSIAAVPIYQLDRWWGFIGFDDCTKERTWSDAEMEALSVVANTLGAALSRQHTETRLMLTSERLSVVLESLPIVTFTSSGGEREEITYITGTVEEITGFRREDFLKDPNFFMGQVHPDDRVLVQSCHLGIEAKGMCGCEFRFRTANGSYRWFSEFCRLIQGPGGTIGRVVGMWQDVTEEKRILQESNTRLQQVIQAHKLASLGEIVAGVVHEINNPNSFIAYNIPLLEEIWKLCEPVLSDHAAANPGWGRRGMSFEELRNDMQEIINAFRIGSDRINRVVSNLKDFARVEEGSQTRPVSVNDVVEKTLMIVGGQIRRSVSRLDLDLGSNLPRVQGHYQKLEQVLANLLVNAHLAIPGREAGWIRISTRHLQRLGAVAVSIEDNGRGMTRPVVDRLFEPFFTTRRDTGGTGLGLSVSYGLIKEHQGVIGVLSRPGIGSRFTVFLPVNSGVTLDMRPLILPLESDVERVEELRMQINGIDGGFVHWFYRDAPSVDRMLEYLEQHPEVDIILMTEPRPGFDTGSLLRAIRASHPLVTTIAWGGMEEDYAGAGGGRPDIHVKGPPDIRKLKGIIDELTRQRF